MEPKFGELTLDELKKAYEACTSDFINCDKKCPLYGSRRERRCVKVMQNSVLELIDAYETTRDLYEYWNKKAGELVGKADKYDSVRNELIRTQELLKNSQDECRKRAEKIKTLRESIDTMDDEHNELAAKLENAEMVRKSLEIDIKNLKDEVKSLKVTLDYKQQLIDEIKKGRDKVQQELNKLQVERKDLNVQLYEANAAKKRLEIENEDIKDKLEYRKNVIDQLMKEKDETNAALLHYHALKNSLHFIGEAMRGDQSGDHEKD